MLLKDLQNIEENHPDYVGNLINFHKRRLTFKIMTDLQTYQQTPYNLQPIIQITKLLNKVPKTDEKELFRLSYEREPKEEAPGTKKA